MAQLSSPQVSVVEFSFSHHHPLSAPEQPREVAPRLIEAGLARPLIVTDPGRIGPSHPRPSGRVPAVCGPGRCNLRRHPQQPR